MNGYRHATFIPLQPPFSVGYSGVAAVALAQPIQAAQRALIQSHRRRAPRPLPQRREIRQLLARARTRATAPAAGRLLRREELLRLKRSVRSRVHQFIVRIIIVVVVVVEVSEIV